MCVRQGAYPRICVCICALQKAFNKALVVPGQVLIEYKDVLSYKDQICAMFDLQYVSS